MYCQTNVDPEFNLLEIEVYSNSFSNFVKFLLLFPYHMIYYDLQNNVIVP